MLQAAAEEPTLPDPHLETGSFTAWPGDTPMRYVATHAVLRTRASRRYAAVGLPKSPPDAGVEEYQRRLLILVLWSRLEGVAIGAGKYRVVRPNEDESALPMHVAAYLTRGTAWRCLEALKASDGRIVISAFGRRRAQGAFDLVFPHARFHGTFLATSGGQP